MSRRSPRLVMTCLLLVLIVCASARAASVRTWSASTSAEFARGTLDGTAIDERGRVRLAPSVENLWGPEEGIVWAVRDDGAGGAFVALSGPGRVLHVPAQGEAATLYAAADEVLVTALADDGEGGVVFGTAPDGQVLRVDGAGEAVPLAETGATFVWSMLRDAHGVLWLGTGLPGRVMRLVSGAEVETVFEAGEDPVRCLAALPDGAVLAGTGGRGRVIRIGSDDRAFVLLDADETEIVSVAAGPQGVVYALAANGQKQPSAAKPTAPAAPAREAGSMRIVVTPPQENGEESPPPAPKPQTPAKTPAQRFKSPPGGALYRIEPDGASRRIWTSRKELPFAMLVADDGTLLVSTGDSGRIWLLDGEGRESRLLRIPSNQASAMARAADGTVLVGGTTDARVARLGAAAREEGSYLGPAVDAGTVADWGNLRWRAELPRGAELNLSVRSGNTAEPDDTWSDWVAVNGRAEAEDVASGLPPARWFQARAELRSRRGESPQLSLLEVRYQPRNREPVIEALTVEPPGVVWIRRPTQSTNRVGPFVADDPVARDVSRGLLPGKRTAVAMRKAYEAGARTFSWKASDPDGDRLRHALEIRREGSESWFPLVTELAESYFSWDARSMEDGMYRVRLVVDDSADNPEGAQREDRRVSEIFHIDNRRPSVGDLKIHRGAEGTSVSFVARDPGGSVAAVEVALDGTAWRPLSPRDDVADAEEERFELELPRRAADAAGWSLLVRVTDAAGNLGGAMWFIEAP